MQSTKQRHEKVSRFLDNLVILRERKNMTRSALAKASGVTTPTIKYLEEQERGPSLDTAYRICDALGVHLSIITKDLN